MKPRCLTLALARLGALLGVALGSIGCGRTVDPHAAWREVVTQVSTLPASRQGAVAPDLTVSNLLARGDHGWGILSDGAQGFVVHSGAVYRIAADGSVDRPAPDAAVAFAQVTWFAPDTMLDVMDLTPRLFQNLMKWKQPDTGWIKAIRITGRFKNLDLRRPSPDGLQKDAEPIQRLERADGTLIGFQMPAVAGSAVPPGLSLFYLSRDGTLAGAVGEFALPIGRIEIDDTPVLHLFLPALKP